MTYAATYETINLIRSLVCQERPDWDSGLVFIVLESHSTQVAPTDLAVAALRAAQNRNLLTPKAIGWRGPHWSGCETLPLDVKPLERCGVCGRIERQCATVRPGGDDHAFEPVPIKTARR